MLNSNMCILSQKIKQMKNIILKFIVVGFFSFTNSIYGQVDTFINSLPTLSPHSNYRDFDYESYQKSQAFPFLDSICAEWDETDIDFYDYGEKSSRKFYGHFIECLAKYQLATNIYTLLVRTNSGYPESYALINILKNGNIYTPVARLEVYLSGGGIGAFYSINNNKIKVHYMSEIDGLGATYSINSAGNFVLDSSTEFDENNYQGIFTY